MDYLHNPLRFSFASLLFNSFPDDLDENSLSSSTVKFTIKNLFLWTEIEFPLRDSEHNFPPHDFLL